MANQGTVLRQHYWNGQQLFGLGMNDHFLRGTLLGEEWMALREIASGGKAAAITQSVQAKLVVLGLIGRDDYGRLTLTEMGRRMVETTG